MGYDGDKMNMELMIMKCKLCYSLGHLEKCEEMAAEIIGTYVPTMICKNKK